MSNTGPMNALTIKTRDGQVHLTSSKILVKICNNTFQNTKMLFPFTRVDLCSIMSFTRSFKNKDLVLEVGRPFRRDTSQFPPKVHFLSLLGVGSEPQTVAIPSDNGQQ